MDIRLIDEAALGSVIPLLMELDDSIPRTVLEERLAEMPGQGYRAVGVYDGDDLVGVSGLWIMTKYYVGKHIEPDNVFIKPAYRGKRLGEQLMQWIYDYAESQGCIASELNCYLSNEGGQKFWEREGYRAIGYHYQKLLGGNQCEKISE